MPTITLENVTKNYKLDRRQQKEQKGKKFEVGVEDVNLTIRQGEFVFLVGSSGKEHAAGPDYRKAQAGQGNGLPG